MIDEKLQIFIVTGYSGAGKSIVLKSLEDVGFFCIDNLPISLLEPLFNSIKINKIALGIDIRGGNIEDLVSFLKNLSSKENLKIIFLAASQPVLLKRFQETRRKHPLLADNISLEEAIDLERNLLKPLLDISDIKINTDQFNVHDLRAYVRNAIITEEKPKMVVCLTSFGFKYGVPQESNFVFDIRSLPNPYFVPDLKGFEGTNQAIKDYLFSQKEVIQYWDKLKDFFMFAIDKSYQEGRYFVHVAIGCTGGRHRSVAFVKELAQLEIDNVQFLIKHRDINRDVSL